MERVTHVAVPAKLDELYLRNTTELWADDANVGMDGGCRIIPADIRSAGSTTEAKRDKQDFGGLNTHRFTP